MILCENITWKIDCQWNAVENLQSPLNKNSNILKRNICNTVNVYELDLKCL